MFFTVFQEFLWVIQPVQHHARNNGFKLDTKTRDAVI